MGWQPGGSSAAAVTSPPSTIVPPGSLTQWQLAKARAKAGTGTANLLVVGDSIAAGQSSGAITDCLLYGWVGRLDALLTPQLGAYAEGYTAGGVAPTGITGSPLVSPSGPYGAFTTPNGAADGPFGQVFAPTGAPPVTFQTLTAKAHPVTGAFPTKVDIFTLDTVAAAQFSWQIDAGGVNTVTTSNGTSVTGAGVLRRTTIALDGLSTHTITLVNVTANGLYFVGHAAYYGASGLGIFRAVNPGFRSVDFATGGGAALGQSGNNGLTPDHWQPITGINNAFNTIGAGFPAKPDLAIIEFGDDAIFGAGIEYFRKALMRIVQACRTGTPATPTSPGCSIVLLSYATFDPYSDNASALAGSQTGAAYEAFRYKSIFSDVAQTQGCVFLDASALFGQNPVAKGLMTAGAVHPTQNGAGAGGGDGHAFLAALLAGGTYQGTAIRGIL